MSCTVLGLACGSARAQWIVSDPAVELTTASQYVWTAAKDVAKIANQAAMINNQITQIMHLVNTFNAVVHGDLGALSSLVPELASAGLMTPMGSEVGELMSSLSGLATTSGQLWGTTQNILNSERYFVPLGGDFRANAINQASQSLAGQKAVGQTLLQSNTDRLNYLAMLRQGLGANRDLKASADTTARFAAETAVSTSQTNQLLAVKQIADAQQATALAQELQVWRCAAEQLVEEANAASSSANTGVMNASLSIPGRSACFDPVIKPTGTATAAADTIGTLTADSDFSGDNGMTADADTDGDSSGGSSTTASSGDGSSGDGGAILAKMSGTPWGSQAVSAANSLGINPTALAATCVMESGCRSGDLTHAGSTVSGTFQMTDTAFAAGSKEALSLNPALASQLSAGKNDAGAQSAAAAGYMMLGVNQLQAQGVSDVNGLALRGWYQFGGANGATIAQASDSQLMAPLLKGLGTSALTGNDISATTTVGQWRATVTSKIGAAATQSVLAGA